MHRRPDLLASFLRPARIPVRPQPFVLLDRLESVVVHGLPRREVMRQGPPGATIAVAVKMASSTRRISVLRGRPPGRAGGIKGPRMAHGLSVKSLGYGFGGFDLGSMSQMSGPFGRGWPHTQGGRTMSATIVARSETSFTVQVEIPYSSSHARLRADHPGTAQPGGRRRHPGGVTAVRHRRLAPHGRLASSSPAKANSPRSTRPPTASPPSHATSTRVPRGARPTARSTGTPGSSSAPPPGSPR